MVTKKTVFVRESNYIKILGRVMSQVSELLSVLFVSDSTLQKIDKFIFIFFGMVKLLK